VWVPVLLAIFSLLTIQPADKGSFPQLRGLLVFPLVRLEISVHLNTGKLGICLVRLNCQRYLMPADSSTDFVRVQT
jgi:hypothetical protein